MRVLVVGSGGREHALCWAIAASPICDKVYCAPGNAGIADVAECIPVAADDIPGIIKLAGDQKIDFVVVGPEGPLVAGIADKLSEAGFKVFGPSAAAAQLEGSKGFMKDLLAKSKVPTAWYQRFTDAAAAKKFVREKGAPIVVKADGLAAGKGVTVCSKVAQAEAAIDAAMTSKEFGDAGNEVVIEECMLGEELSYFVLTDGFAVLPLGGAQDHKAVGDGDTGPNTGGMGAYSPAPVLTPDLEEKILRDIIKPTLRGMAAIGAPFKGVLFCGLMITKDGPKVIEYNVRFGDPECQTLMMRLKSDILPALIATADDQLANIDLRWKDETAVLVVMAANGYPGAYKKGSVIDGLSDAIAVEGAHVFHAGTKAETKDGKKVITAVGGRVLGVAASAKTVSDAQAIAYQAVKAIKWPEGFCRSDIGWRAIEREKAAASPTKG